MKTILVTGGYGFIGSNFIKYMLKNHPGIKIVNMDCLTYAANLKNLKDIENDKRFVFEKANITNEKDVERIFKKYSPDVVVNFAAESCVDRSFANPQLFIETNVLGTITLVCCAQKFFNKSNLFVQMSTDEVYGTLPKDKSIRFTEKTPLNPLNPYSTSKATADVFLLSKIKNDKFPAIIVRACNNFGECQNIEKLIPKVFDAACKSNDILVHGNGLQTRDWIYVEDTCSALDIVLEKGKIGQIYNIGSDNERTNMQIIKKIVRYVKENINKNCSMNLVKHIANRPALENRYAIDHNKITSELGWKSQTNFENAFEKTMLWYQKNLLDRKS